jgi:hypothetical protein
MFFLNFDVLIFVVLTFSRLNDDSRKKTSLFSQVTDRVLKRRRGQGNPVSQVNTSLPIVFITVESFYELKNMLSLLRLLYI